MTDLDTTDRRGAERLLLRSAWHARGWLAAAGATAVVLAVLETALPGVLGRAVDSVIGRAGDVWIVAAALVVTALAGADALDDLAVGMATAQSTAWLRRGLLRHFVRAGMAASKRIAPGDFAGRMVSNSTYAGRAGTDIVRAAANVLPAAGAFIALALIDPWLLLVVAAGMPLLFVVLRAFLRDSSGLASRYFAIQGAIAGRLGDALGGARTIAASRTEDRETERVLAELPDLHREGLGMWHAQGRIAVQQGLLMPLLEVAVLALAGVELAHGRISPGEMLAAAQYAVLATSLLSTLPALTRLVRARAGAQRVDEVLREPEVRYGATAVPDGPGSIEFRDVTVHAGDRAVIDELSLTIDGGSLTAIVGRSGAGKSLFAALAGRLFDPDSGTVLFDGADMRTLPHDELRTLIGYAFERPSLFGATIEDAVAFGVTRPSPGAVTEAARRADADDFVRRLPEGYANRLAATPMSGGETQRIGLARAFAHPGRVLILDDVAASLDTVTEYRIASVLTTALAHRTRIVVAHRAATAARADTVVWLEGGRVRAVAPHAVLWHNLGYRAIFDPGALTPGPNGNGHKPTLDAG
ncbi:MAG: ABC transporter ATP-binding protein [Candidatus Dormibacteria bacterium]